MRIKKVYCGCSLAADELQQNTTRKEIGNNMHIAVDGNLLCGKKTGMGIVVYHVLKYWKSTDKHSITVYCPEKLDERYSCLIGRNGIKIRVLGKANYFKWEQIVLPKAVKQDRADVLWCPYNTAPIKCPCKMVVTINDVIYMNSSLKSAPSVYKKIGIIYRKHIVPIAARYARTIISISQYAKQEISYCFPKERHKIKVILLGVDKSSVKFDSDDEKKFFQEHGIRKPYILGFGSLELRKNSLQLIRAYDALPKEITDTYQLILFGFRDYERSEDHLYIKTHDLEKHIKILEYISDEEKATLYSESSMFVFPTLSEGFGIPVLEAFAAQTPVITSNITALPEIAGDAAVLVNPGNMDEISEAIKTLIEKPEKRHELIQAGMHQLNKFSWEDTAKKIFEEIRLVGAE